MAYDIRFRSSVGVREEGNSTMKTPASSDPPTHHLGHMRKPRKKPASSDPPTHYLGHAQTLEITCSRCSSLAPNGIYAQSAIKV